MGYMVVFLIFWGLMMKLTGGNSTLAYMASAVITLSFVGWMGKVEDDYHKERFPEVKENEDCEICDKAHKIKKG